MTRREKSAAVEMLVGFCKGLLATDCNGEVVRSRLASAIGEYELASEREHLGLPWIAEHNGDNTYMVLDRDDSVLCERVTHAQAKVIERSGRIYAALDKLLSFYRDETGEVPLVPRELDTPQSAAKTCERELVEAGWLK